MRKPWLSYRFLYSFFTSRLVAVVHKSISTYHVTIGTSEVFYLFSSSIRKLNVLFPSKAVADTTASTRVHGVFIGPTQPYHYSHVHLRNDACPVAFILQSVESILSTSNFRLPNSPIVDVKVWYLSALFRLTVL